MRNDDDPIDRLLEHSQKLFADCQRIRQEMEAGSYVTHDEVMSLLEQDDEVVGK